MKNSFKNLLVVFFSLSLLNGQCMENDQPQQEINDYSGYYTGTYPRVLPAWAISKWQEIEKAQIETGNPENPKTYSPEDLELVKALCQFDTESLYAVGIKFRDNKYGTSKKGSPQYYIETEPFFWNLSIKGHTKAMHNYAVLRYEQKDYKEAYKWFYKANASTIGGFLPSANNMGRIIQTEKISSSEIEQIEAECRLFPYPSPHSIPFTFQTWVQFTGSYALECLSNYVTGKFIKLSLYEHIQRILTLSGSFCNECYENFKKGDPSSLTKMARHLEDSRIMYDIDKGWNEGKKVYPPSFNGWAVAYFEKIISTYLLEKAAILGDVDAQYSLADAFSALHPLKGGAYERLYITRPIPVENREAALYWYLLVEKGTTDRSVLRYIYYNIGFNLELGGEKEPFPAYNRESLPQTMRSADCYWSVPRIRANVKNSFARKALPYFNAAAQLGNTLAKMKLAHFLEQGEIVEENPVLAYQLYSEVLRLNPYYYGEEGKERMAWMSYIGRGTEKDAILADQLYQQCSFLPQCLIRAAHLTIGCSLKQDFNEALEILLGNNIGGGRFYRYHWRHVEIDYWFTAQKFKKLLLNRLVIEQEIIRDLKESHFENEIPKFEEAVRLVGEFYRERNKLESRGLVPPINPDNELGSIHFC